MVIEITFVVEWLIVWLIAWLSVWLTYCLSFVDYLDINRFLLIFALQCWTWLGQCAHTRINRILFNIVVVLTYRQGHRIRLVGLFRCVRRSRNIQHISERCFPIDNLIKPFPIPTDFYAHNYERSRRIEIGYGMNKKKRLFHRILRSLRSAYL